MVFIGLTLIFPGDKDTGPFEKGLGTGGNSSEFIILVQRKKVIKPIFINAVFIYAKKVVTTFVPIQSVVIHKKKLVYCMGQYTCKGEKEH